MRKGGGGLGLISKKLVKFDVVGVLPESLFPVPRSQHSHLEHSLFLPQNCLALAFPCLKKKKKGRGYNAIIPKLLLPQSPKVIYKSQKFTAVTSAVTRQKGFSERPAEELPLRGQSNWIGTRGPVKTPQEAIAGGGDSCQGRFCPDSALVLGG